MTGLAACSQLHGSTSVGLRSPGVEAQRVEQVVMQRWRQQISAARPVILPRLVGAPPRQIRELAQNVLAAFAIDDSGSMYGSFGDPTGIRYAAAQSLVAMQRRSGGGLAGVVHWGTSAPEDMVTPLVDVCRKQRLLD